MSDDTKKFNQEQYDLLMRCSDKEDMTEWNYFRERVNEKIVLNGADLMGFMLFDANLSGADLCGANLSDAQLLRADLSGANLKLAGLNDAILFGATLNNATFEGADLSGAILRNIDIINVNLSNAMMFRADLSRANLCGTNLSSASLDYAFLNNAILTCVDFSGATFKGTTLIKADLTNANITGAMLYGTSRENWIINDIKCNYVYWDKERAERTPKDRNFEPNEFEELYKSLPEIIYYFSDELTPLTPLLMDKVVTSVQQKHPELKLKLDSFHSRGQPHAVFTVLKKKDTEKALKAITKGYESANLKLEGKVEVLKELLSGALDRPQLIQQANHIINNPEVIEHIGNKIDMNSENDTNIATDQGTVDVTTTSNQDVHTVYNIIDKAITESEANPDNQQDAKEQLEKLNAELSKPEPDKSRAKRCFDYIVEIVPKVAEKVPWTKIIENGLGL